MDTRIGIGTYSTDFGGIGGRIKARPEDFEVIEQISDKALGAIRREGEVGGSDGGSNGVGKEGGYVVYRLKKRGIDTAHAISDIRAKRGLRLKPLGLKDASAITEQFVCAMGRSRGGSNNNSSSSSSKSSSSDTDIIITTDRYTLSRVGFVDRPLTKKNMISNRFRIRITGCTGDPSSFDGGCNILNFYGYQRFGSGRAVTHLVGRAMVQEDFGLAVEIILSHRSAYDSPRNDEIRRMLSDTSNYTQQCLQQIPRSMDIERAVLGQMIDHGDPARAMRAVPLQMRRFYVQAYQSYIFNLSLSLAQEQGENLSGVLPGDICFDKKSVVGKHVAGPGRSLALPLVGYSYYKKTRFNPQISEVLRSEGVAPRDFYIKQMQEASSEGGFRQTVMTCTDYNAHGDMVEFTLSRGSFATMLLREIIKPADPILAGF